MRRHWLIFLATPALMAQKCTGDTGNSGTDSACDAFCAASAEACPSDTECEHSCDEAPNGPTSDDVACMEAATTCDEASPCWTPLYQQ
ncbi:MAG: hypothetical protein ABIO70_15240 [Pseudomonadota bacterium]